MKHEKGSILALTLFAGMIMLTCFNASVITDESEKNAGPDVNFYGILEDHAHKSEVSNILIGGRYKEIPFYQQATVRPSENTNEVAAVIDPKQNKTVLNLQDIKSISLQHPHNPTTSNIMINNKMYIEIVVESLHGNKRKFLIEASRKITCQEIEKNAEIKDSPAVIQNRDLNFTHLKKLTIKGYKSNYPYQNANIDVHHKSVQNRQSSEHKNIVQEKIQFRNNAAELLNAIEENVKNLPMDNPSAFETMQATILTLLKSLRDQLQKFLDMIK